jgi:hypothetical protein
MRWVAGAVLVIAVAGCGGSSKRASTCAAPGNHWYGEALLHVPPGAGPRPLVVAFHGGGQSGGSSPSTPACRGTPTGTASRSSTPPLPASGGSGASTTRSGPTTSRASPR